MYEPLRTELEIIDDYEKRGMIDSAMAIHAMNETIPDLNISKITMKQTIADEYYMRRLSLLVFAHVESDRIAKEDRENPKYQNKYFRPPEPAMRIIRRYYDIVENTHIKHVPSSTQELYANLIREYLKNIEKIGK